MKKKSLNLFNKQKFLRNFTKHKKMNDAQIQNKTTKEFVD